MHAGSARTATDSTSDTPAWTGSRASVDRPDWSHPPQRSGDRGGGHSLRAANSEMIDQLVQHRPKGFHRHLPPRHAQTAGRRCRHHTQRTASFLRQIRQHRRITRPQIGACQQHHRNNDRTRRPSSCTREARRHTGQRNSEVMEKIMRGWRRAHKARRNFYKSLSICILRLVVK